MTKKVCYVCCEGDGRFKFPKDNTRLKEWMESLCIRDIPPDHARICAGHFLSHEIDVSVTGRRSINQLALPLKGSHQHKKTFLFIYSSLKLGVLYFHIIGWKTIIKAFEFTERSKHMYT